MDMRRLRWEAKFMAETIRECLFWLPLWVSIAGLAGAAVGLFTVLCR